MFGFPQMLYNLNYTKQLLFENYIHLLRQQLMIILIIELSIDYFQEFKSVIVVVGKKKKITIFQLDRLLVLSNL